VTRRRPGPAERLTERHGDLRIALVVAQRMLNFGWFSLIRCSRATALRLVGTMIVLESASAPQELSLRLPCFRRGTRVPAREFGALGRPTSGSLSPRRAAESAASLAASRPPPLGVPVTSPKTADGARVLAEDRSPTSRRSSCRPRRRPVLENTLIKETPAKFNIRRRRQEYPQMRDAR